MEDNTFLTTTIKDFPNYTLRSNGEVYDNVKNKVVTKLVSGKNVCVMLSNDFGKFRFSLPQLVAKHFLIGKKTKYVKHLDGNYSNNNSSNLAFCGFKDLMDKNKPRKKKQNSISINQIIEAYKHYFQNASIDDLKSLFQGYLKYCELEILNKRGSLKAISKKQKIFLQHARGMTYKDLQTKFNCSQYYIKQAILNARKELITAILRDVECGKLKYNPSIQKTPHNQIKKRFADYKRRFGISSKSANRFQ